MVQGKNNNSVSDKNRKNYKGKEEEESFARRRACGRTREAAGKSDIYNTKQKRAITRERGGSSVGNDCR